MLLMFLLVSFLKLVISEDELIFANVLFRHGNRAPLRTFSSDPYSTSWLGEEGELTNIGIQQAFELGQFLRKRYRNLTNNGIYSSKNVYVLSSDVERTLMSAEANLAGFFPPLGDQIWNENLQWQPIPVHTMPAEMDYLLQMTRPCPLLDYKLRLSLKSPGSKMYEDFIKLGMTLAAKEANATIREYDDFGKIFDEILVEKMDNMELEKWMMDIFLFGELYEELIDIAAHLPDSIFNEMIRLRSGHLVKDMLDHFEDKKNSKLTPDRSIWIYSGHDYTINKFMTFLGFHEISPPYTACILFELYKSNDNFYVQLFYKKTIGLDGTPLKALHIPKCGRKCNLDEFNRIYKDALPTADFDTTCRLPVP